jgi:hypothetical protein
LDLVFIFAPRKRGIVHCKTGKRGILNKFKNILKIACRFKKNNYFCTRFETQARRGKDTFIDILD